MHGQQNIRINLSRYLRSTKQKPHMESVYVPPYVRGIKEVKHSSNLYENWQIRVSRNYVKQG